MSTHNVIHFYFTFPDVPDDGRTESRTSQSRLVAFSERLLVIRDDSQVVSRTPGFTVAALPYKATNTSFVGSPRETYSSSKLLCIYGTRFTGLSSLYLREVVTVWSQSWIHTSVPAGGKADAIQPAWQKILCPRSFDKYSWLTWDFSPSFSSPMN